MSGENTTSEMPQIGDDEFEGPADKTLRSKPTPDQEERIEQTLEEMDKDTGASAKEKIEKPLTPEQIAKKYEEGLIEVGLTVDKARGIIENIVVNGFHEESTRIGPLTFRYRTRGHSDTLRTYRAVESSGIGMPEAMKEFINRHNAAGSLISWGDRKFSHPEEEEEREAEFKKRFDFLTSGVADLVAVKMMQIIYDFDVKMSAVMADGSPQDF
jgi:hypothetical protein